jgi:hypothetical protein
LIASEFTIRFFHLSTDAPRTYKNDNGNVNYYPNQEGYWDGGRHKWYINEMGYPGKNIPVSKNNLVLLIGDSYIQNFMNPDSCRQKSYLDSLNPNLNFLEISMAGLNLLGYLEYSKPLDSLNPRLKLIYINSKDFISNIQNKNEVGGYKVNLETNKLIYPKYQGSKTKDFIYNFKFPYYLYRKNIDLFQGKRFKRKNADVLKRVRSINYTETRKLLDFINKNYITSNVIFIFHPNSDSTLIEVCRESGIRCFELKQEKNEKWSTREDGHWSCYGHRKVADQVSTVLMKNLSILIDSAK